MPSQTCTGAGNANKTPLFALFFLPPEIVSPGCKQLTSQNKQAFASSRVANMWRGDKAFLAPLGSALSHSMKEVEQSAPSPLALTTTPWRICCILSVQSTKATRLAQFWRAFRHLLYHSGVPNSPRYQHRAATDLRGQAGALEDN
ncbi:uncharacterized [Tachysurus ichikawai]